jgi:metal-dependent HD superfamily phosphatase/phosphodiesterase
MRSQKEINLNSKIIETVEALKLSGKALEVTRLATNDDEIQGMQEYANTVSIKRLNYNDHGPVHMRTVVLNAVIMMKLLRETGVTVSLEKEECGDFEDALTAVILAAMLHDIGMAVGRQDHEFHSAYLSAPILERLLAQVYGGDIMKRTMIRALALEGISGHMGNKTVHSLEAGVVQVADGCDMTKGRARISMALASQPRVGDIHQYSANSIDELDISGGKEKPIRIEAFMSSEVGLFQIEEVLLAKIAGSTAKSYIELYAQVHGTSPRRYL